MVLNVIKRNGNKVPYNHNKIKDAIIQAWNKIELPDIKQIDGIVNIVGTILKSDKFYKNKLDNEINITINQIEDVILSTLYLKGLTDIADSYSFYRAKRNQQRENPSEIDKVLYNKEEVALENANKNNVLNHIKNAYLAEIPSKEAMREALPPECLEAHDKGIVYFHDMAYSFRNLTNCELLNLEKLFEHGCEINSTWIETPKSFRTACTIATQILTHVASNTYGGCTINLLHLAKFVDVSRKKIKNKYEKYNLDEKTKNKIIEDELNKEIKDGLQTFAYQCQTLCSNVGQAVFLTVSVYLNEDPKYTDDLITVYEEMLRQRIQGFKNKNGIYENPNFPKILYFLDKDTMKGGKYYLTTILSAECSSKRLTPDYMSVKKHMQIKGVITPSMGCRALLSSYKDEYGNFVTWGRGNIGVQSLNLPYIVMENNKEKSEQKMFENIDKYLDIAYRDLIWRVNHTAKIKAKSCPILWQYGALAELNPEDNLSSIVYGGYMTVTIGYSGLYEAVKYMTGEGHWNKYDNKKGNKLGNKILDYINKRNRELGEELNVSIALYATPAEVLTDKFARACIRDFGHIGDGSQRLYLTNGYHIPVFQNINAFDKLTYESEFSDKTVGGSISYVEVPNMSNNLDAMLSIINHIGNTCLYAEINSEISTCSVCGFNGYDFPKVLDPKDNTVRWKCPNCGETDPEKVRTSYRICGYISNYTPNQGRSEDIMNRVKHMNINEDKEN